MINRRTLVSLVLSASMLIVAGTALAKNAHHSDGHNLLGAKLGQNGKHEMSTVALDATVGELDPDAIARVS
jgi:hypothetical protein